MTRSSVPRIGRNPRIQAMTGGDKGSDRSSEGRDPAGRLAAGWFKLGRLARIVEAAGAVAHQREADQDPDDRGGGYRQKHADKAVKRAAGKQREDDPDRMEMDAVADELWGRHVRIDQLPEREDADHDEDRRPAAVLQRREADRQD